MHVDGVKCIQQVATFNTLAHNLLPFFLVHRHDMTGGNTFDLYTTFITMKSEGSNLKLPLPSLQTIFQQNNAVNEGKRICFVFDPLVAIVWGE